MKNLSIAFCLLLLKNISYAQKNMMLWYDKPADAWTAALPVGNGRLGAMVFGGVENELLQLNEATFWTGGPVTHNINPQAKEYLPLVREALFNKKYDEAEQLCKKIQGLYSESFLPLADLHIEQDFGRRQPSNYTRSLNISDAICTTNFTVDGIKYKREVFVSSPAQVIVIKISADVVKKISCTIKAGSQVHFANEILSEDLLAMNGKAPAHADPSYYNINKEPVIYEDAGNCRGMRFRMLVKALHEDGTIMTDTSGMHIKNASEVVLLISAATSFNGFDKCPDKDGKDEKKLASDYLNNALKKSYTVLWNEHEKGYHDYFNRVSLTLNNDTAKNNLPTDERVKSYTAGGKDAALEALYFQYGRYLLISSSRTPNVPANLQGIWNKEMRPPWSANYTTNINVQMNYWPSEVCNLSEMHVPMFGLIENLHTTGTATAKEFYGMKGWVVHHNSDIWAMSNPVGDRGNGDPKWANWSMGANWLCRDLWEHYLFSGNKKFLRDTAYPLMKGAAEFTFGWLVFDSSLGYLVTAPSVSPENVYYYDSNKVSGTSIATTMDMSIIRDLLDNIIAASEILNIDKAFIDTVIEKKNKLYPFKTGHKGNLQEWFEDYEDVEPHHRHTSHLYGLYPGTQISPVATPQLANAARETLNQRGDDGTGWSLAWKVNFWARLLDGDHAYKLFRNLLRYTNETETDYGSHGGAYPNLFDAHPPFQIDGNFAGTAGIAEMLLQSQSNELYLLPAMPQAWQSGAINGLRARGGFNVSIDWKENKFNNAKIISLLGNNCVVRTNEPVLLKGTNIKSEKSAHGYVLSFKTIKGKLYEVIRD